MLRLIFIRRPRGWAFCTKWGKMVYVKGTYPLILKIPGFLLQASLLSK